MLLGSTTECFPAQEKRFEITANILKILNSKNIPYTILTKSHLIGSYLKIISQNPENKIFFTFNFQSDKLIRLIEKKSPSIKQRLEAIRKIIAAKINLRIHIGPFIPYISDLEKILKLLPKGVEEIDIELYHHKQGNFDKIIAAIENSLGREPASGLNQIYKDENRYCVYTKTLVNKIKELKNQYCFCFYPIIPEFNKFYNCEIAYEKPLL